MAATSVIPISAGGVTGKSPDAGFSALGHPTLPAGCTAPRNRVKNGKQGGELLHQDFLADRLCDESSMPARGRP